MVLRAGSLGSVATPPAVSAARGHLSYVVQTIRLSRETSARMEQRAHAVVRLDLYASDDARQLSESCCLVSSRGFRGWRTSTGRWNGACSAIHLGLVRLPGYRYCFQ
jgi:hypothetical protein